MVDDEFTCLWYLYASADYFKRDLASRLHPLHACAETFYANADFRTPAQWLLSSHSPNLPETIVLRDHLSSDAQEAAPTNAWLQVTKFGATGGQRVPSNARIEYYLSLRSMEDPKAPARQLLRKRIDISVTACRPGCSVNRFVPELPQPSWIQDLRYLTNNPSMSLCFLTDDWPTDEMLTIEYTRRKNARGRNEKGNRATPGARHPAKESNPWYRWPTLR
jgi:hypothetical protein